jgi:metal-responsive CopG/Arc/MetJ family transcriptional regulator
MTTVSLRLPDDLLKEADKRAQELHIPRAEYIRRAIESLNTKAMANHRRHRMMEASRRVRAESMRVNAEFNAIEDAPDA